MSLGRIAGLATSCLLLAAALSSCTATAKITDVYMALDAAGNRKRTVFFADSEQVHCVLEAGISRPGVTIEVLFRQLQAYNPQDGKYFDTDRVYANSEFSPAPSNGGNTTLATQLTFTGPDGNPVANEPLETGRFQCEAYLDGKLEGVAIFNINFSDCPIAEIIQGTRCLGFYQLDRECPRYGLSSGDNAKCSCKPGGWDCR